MSRYVALGDSYAAGIGGGRQRGQMERTDAGYPLQVGRRLGLPTAYQAVLGATTDDVIRDQLSALGDDTELVTLTAGGNDVGFVPVLLEVVQPAWVSRSDEAIDGAVGLIRDELPDRLRRVLEGIAAAAPQAQILVTGYPHLFNEISDCSLFTFVSVGEMKRLTSVADELVATILSIATDAGAFTVDVRPPFDGHQVCDPTEWLNGLSLPLQDSYHPNETGHAGYADAICAALPHDATGADEMPVADGYALGSAPRFGLPSLMSERSMRGATERGLDPRMIADLAGRSEDETAAMADREDAARRLQELHESIAPSTG